MKIPSHHRPFLNRFGFPFTRSKMTGLLFAGALTASLNSAVAQVNVSVDPSKTWIGYMNVFELPVNGGAYVFGSTWGPADLNASFSGDILTFTPNTSIARDNASTDTFWWQENGSGNKNMEANFYVEDDTLSGQEVTFSGHCWTNTLAAPYNSSAVVFIKDFAPDYSTFTTTTSNLTGGFFSIMLPTTAGDHIQYGFQMTGPNATLAEISSLGSVVISSNPPPNGPVIAAPLANASVLLSSNISLSVTASGSDLSYQWEKNGVPLTDGSGISGATTATLALTGVTGDAEGEYSVTASNSVGTATSSAYLTVLNPSHLTVNPRAGWVGYMNVFDLEMAYQFGSAWALVDLPATFNSGVLTLSPNTGTYNAADSYWVNPDGSGAKNLEALMYQQFDGLAGMTVTFVGYCQSNSLVAPYTSKAFIRDFTPDFSSFTETSVPLVSGQAFTVTASTTPGDHIQWGFDTFGPDANPATVESLGKALVTINSPGMQVTHVSGGTSLSFATESGLNYVVQYKNNLSDASWQTLDSVSGNGSVRSVIDSANQSTRFYRLAIQ